jgi:hypothetical protein
VIAGLPGWQELRSDVLDLYGHRLFDLGTLHAFEAQVAFLPSPAKRPAGKRVAGDRVSAGIAVPCEMLCRAPT